MSVKGREGSHRAFINHFSWRARDLGQLYKDDILGIIAAVLWWDLCGSLDFLAGCSSFSTLSNIDICGLMKTKLVFYFFKESSSFSKLLAFIAVFEDNE